MPNTDYALKLLDARNAATAGKVANVVAASEGENEFERTPWGPFKILDIANRLQYPIANTARRITDVKKQYSGKDYLQGIWGGIAGKERSSFTDVLDNMGWRPTTTAGKIGRGVVGLGADILTDPLTYATLGGSSALGSAKSAGKVVKIGSATVNVGKAKNMERVLTMLGKRMAKAGVADDIIKTTLDGFRGVQKVGVADDLAKVLTQYGFKASPVKAASTWAKQAKLGDRALLQMGIPFTDARVKVPIPGEQKFWNAATYLNNRLQAGKMITNKNVWKAMPAINKTTKEAMFDGNMVRIGDEFFDVADKRQASLIRGKLLRKLAEDGADSETIGNFAKYLEDVKASDKGLAQGVVDTLKSYGLDAEKANLRGFRSQRIATHFGKSPIAQGAGDVANTLSDWFNIVPENAKKIRRIARGGSQKKALEEADKVLKAQVNDILERGLPKDGYVNILVDGNLYSQVKRAKSKSVLDKLIAEGKNAVIQTDFGKARFGENVVDITPELEKALRTDVGAIVSHPAVKHELRKLERAGEEITAEKIANSLNVLKAGSEEAKNAPHYRWWSRGYENAQKLGTNEARFLEGLDPETIERTQQTIMRSFNSPEGVKDIMTLADTIEGVENASIGMGRVGKAGATRYHQQMGMRRTPRNLELSDSERLLSRGKGTASAFQPLEASHGQTFAEARMGYVSPTVQKHLMENADKVIKYDPITGRPILGAEILGKDYQQAMGKARSVANKIEEAERLESNAVNRLNLGQDNLIKAQANVDEVSDRVAKRAASVFERKQKRVDYWTEQLTARTDTAKELDNQIAEARKWVEWQREANASYRDYALKQPNKNPALLKALKDSEDNLAQAEARLQKFIDLRKKNDALFSTAMAERDKLLSSQAKFVGAETTSVEKQIVSDLQKKIDVLEKQMEAAKKAGRPASNTQIKRLSRLKAAQANAISQAQEKATAEALSAYQKESSKILHEVRDIAREHHLPVNVSDKSLEILDKTNPELAQNIRRQIGKVHGMERQQLDALKQTKQAFVDDAIAKATKQIEDEYAPLIQRAEADIETSRPSVSALKKEMKADIAQAKQELAQAQEALEQPTARTTRNLERGDQRVARAEEDVLKAQARREAYNPIIEDAQLRKMYAEEDLANYTEQFANRQKEARETAQRYVDEATQRVEKLEAQATARNKTVAELQKEYDDFINQAEQAAKTRRPLEFSEDLEQGLIKTLSEAQRMMQNRITLEAMVKYGEHITDNNDLKYGQVRASDFLNQQIIKEALIGDAVDRSVDDVIMGLGGKELLDKLQHTALPYQMVAPLNAMFEVSKADNTILQTYDFVLSLLKPAMLAAPSTHTRNTISSFLMSVAAGDFKNPIRGINNLRKALAWVVFGHDSEMEIRGKKYLLSNLWDMLQTHGGANSNRTMGELLDKPATMLNNAFTRGARKVNEKIYWLPGAYANATEDTFRFAHFMKELFEGSTVDEAVESIAKHFYDYGDLSRTEQKVFRRIFPFYTFSKNNLAANLRYLRTNPAYVTLPYRLARASNQVTEGDPDAIPMEYMDNPKNKWLIDQGAFRLPWDGTAFATMQGFLPASDISILAPKEAAEKLVGDISPIIKTPIEVALNHDTFTGKEIYSPAQQTQFYYGLDVDPRVIHFLKPVRALDTINRGLINMFPEWAERHGTPVKNPDATLAERAGITSGSITGIRHWRQEKERVKKNAIQDLNKNIEDIEYKIRQFPNAAPKVMDNWLKTREALIEQRSKIK